MLDQVRVAHPSLSAEYAARHEYRVFSGENLFYVGCFCCGRFHVARGHRTGERVTFSRRSDAVRFAKNRNQICQGAR